MIWNAVDLTDPNLRLLYADLSRELKGRRAWVVDVFVDEGDATRELHGKLRTQTDYSWWLKLYNEFGRHVFPMAEDLWL